MKTTNKRRIAYAIASVLLFAVEVLIARYVHDVIIRPYVGDMLVVILIYCVVRVVIPFGHKWLPLWIFLFAASLECLQYFHLVQILRLENHKILRIVIGSTFDLKDIGCYGIGCMLLGIVSYFKERAWENE